MQHKKIVILGTGGTVAGMASQAASYIDYTAAQLGENQVVIAIRGLKTHAGVLTEQRAQIDSKDMSFKV